MERTELVIMLIISFSVSGLLHREAGLLGLEGRGAGCGGGTRPGKTWCSELGGGKSTLEETSEGCGILAELVPSAVTGAE